MDLTSGRACHPYGQTSTLHTFCIPKYLLTYLLTPPRLRQSDFALSLYNDTWKVFIRIPSNPSIAARAHCPLTTGILCFSDPQPFESVTLSCH